ncbi:MAG: hypothetical protein MUE40_11180 [Anaerolineae bacterium]|jgi:hypothetical protein|nr:hypothetical protein [Anaerolineae bacterium]
MSDDNEITVWKVLGTVAKGVGRSVQLLGEGTAAAIGAANAGKIAVETSMPVTEITSVFNTTDKTLRFVNRETARDEREILGQSAVTLKTEQTAGAWVPWYDPPIYGDFNRRHLEIIVDDLPVMYIWQKGDYIYWTNRLDSEGRPAKAYKMGGVTHVGGKRTLVVRHDPELGYSAFLTNTVDGK